MKKSFRAALILAGILIWSSQTLVYAQTSVIKTVSYDISQTAHKVTVKVDFEKSTDTKIGIADNKIDSVILCARTGNTGEYRKVEGEQKETARDFVIDIVGPAPPRFTLDEGWTAFSFHIGASPTGKCKDIAKREPSFDIQIAKEKLPTAAPAFKVVDNSSVWIADRPSGDTRTRSLSLKVNPSTCGKFKVVVKEGTTVYGESDEVIRCEGGGEPIAIKTNQANQIQDNKPYPVFIDGKAEAIGTFTPRFIPTNAVREVEFVDGTTTTDLQKSSSVVVMDTVTKKTVKLRTKENSNLDILLGENSCVKISPKGADGGQDREFELDLKDCKKGIVSFRVTAKGGMGQVLSDAELAKVYALTIDNEIKIDGPISFDTSTGKTLITYKLNRQIKNSVTITAGGKSLTINLPGVFNETKKLYEAELPSNIISAIQEAATVDLKATVGSGTDVKPKSVPVIFTVSDTSSGESKSLGSFEMRAYGFNANLLKAINETPKIENEATAREEARRLLEIAPGDASSAEATSAIEFIRKMLQEKPGAGRSNVKNILFFVAKVGLSFLGLPIPIK